MTKNKFTLKNQLTDKGFPTHSRFYQTAHRHADKLEKERYPKGYAQMKKVDEKLKKHELAGKNLPSGKIYVSKKVPKQYRKEVAFHEMTENKAIKRLERRKKR